MVKLEGTRGRRRVLSARTEPDRHNVSGSPSRPFAPALPNDKLTETSTLAATDGPLTSKGVEFQANDDEFWGFKTVIAKTGLSRSSLYSYVAQGIFARQRRLDPRRVGWLASEVRAWILSRPR
jgi:prophage regulatory protein